MRFDAFTVLMTIYLMMLACNLLMPMSYSDDYLYKFIITKETIFRNFVPDSAVRVSSIGDIILSQWNHYMIWSGRTVAHSILQLFDWFGKGLFDFVNAFVFVVIVMEIYWIVDRGRVSFDFRPSRLIWIFFALWIFTPGFSTVYLWMTGACNYPWMSAILLAFILPYVRKWFDAARRPINPIVMLIIGIVAGWTNENTVCWFIVAIAAMIYVCRRNGLLESWMIAGLIGLSIGYALMIFAPGNMERTAFTIPQGYFYDLSDRLAKSSLIFGFGLWLQMLLWYFFIRTLIGQREFGDDADVKCSLIVAKIFAAISVASSVIMFLVPDFPMRSMFMSILCLIIAVTILIRLQHETGLNQLDESARKFLHVLGVIAFSVIFCTTIVGLSALMQYDGELQRLVDRARIEQPDEVLVINRFEYPPWMDFCSALHLPNIIFDEDHDETFWSNAAYAKYNGIKGIRVKSTKPEGGDRDGDDR